MSGQEQGARGDAHQPPQVDNDAHDAWIKEMESRRDAQDYAGYRGTVSNVGYAGPPGTPVQEGPTYPPEPSKIAPRVPRMGAHVIVSEAELSAYKGFYFVVGMLAGAIISNAIAWIVYVLVTSGMVSK